MGKTTPSTTQLIFDTVEETRSLYKGLAPDDQRRMDMMFKLVIKHKVAIANAKSLLPIEVLCILMLLEVYKQNNELHHAQYEEIKRLRKAMEAAGLITEEELPAFEEESVNLIDMLEQMEAASIATDEATPKIGS